MSTPKRPNNAASRPAASNRQEADWKADWWELDDPFDDLPAAMLTAPQIANYARATGVMFPFDEKLIKGATYEVGISGRAYFWDETDVKHEIDVGANPSRELTLPANTITFVETDVEFRLPQYIAIRFNLHIKLVHRGLLLGTGPIVDPGFRGRLLIPLHNLTNSPYVISEGEKIVWIEFSKTLFGVTSSRNGYEPKPADYRLFPASKRWLSSSTYFDKANSGNAIVSSITGIIGLTNRKIDKFKSRLNTLQVFGYIGILVTVILSLYSSWSLYSSALDIIKTYTSDHQELVSKVEQLERCRKIPQLPSCK